MTLDHRFRTVPAAVRRPTASAAVQRSAATVARPLQKRVGNHAAQVFVSRLPARIQRKKTLPEKTTETYRYTYRHEETEYAFTSMTVKGIEFRLGVPTREIRKIETMLPAFAEEIAKGNALIADPHFRIRLCVIAETDNQYAKYKGKPVLVIKWSTAGIGAIRHESGHAIFEFYRAPSGKKSSQTGKASLVLADIYARLARTKNVPGVLRSPDGKEVRSWLPAGIWIADPSQWSPGLPSEHPWPDPDEYFASARRAYLTNREGLQAAIAKFTKLDPKVKEPAADLMRVLGQLEAKKRPSEPKTFSEDAKEDLKEVQEAVNLESTVAKEDEIITRLALDPSTLAPKP